MDLNAQTLTALTTGFRTSFRAGFEGVTPQWNRVAMRIPSTTAQNNYSWLGDMPKMREWMGDRVVKQLGGADYTIKNREFELTIGVKKTDIEDDNIGFYSPMIQDMGRSAAIHPDELVFQTLANGFAQNGYDGQNFFDTDHPVGPDGKEVSVSNMQEGTSSPWMLLDTTRVVKPLIFQERKAANRIISRTAEDSDNVFNRQKYEYGVDGRYNVGFGFWQMAFGSKAELTAANFKAARKAMREFKNDEGIPLGINPNLLVIGSSNADVAEELFTKARLANGEDNTLLGKIEILISPWWS